MSQAATSPSDASTFSQMRVNEIHWHTVDICRARHVNNKILREQVLIWRNVIGLCHLVYSKGISYPRSCSVAMIDFGDICFLWKQFLWCWRYFSNHNRRQLLIKVLSNLFAIEIILFLAIAWGWKCLLAASEMILTNTKYLSKLYIIYRNRTNQRYSAVQILITNA